MKKKKFWIHIFLSLTIFLTLAFDDIILNKTTRFRTTSYFAGKGNLNGFLKKGQKASVLAIDTNKKYGVGVQVRIKTGKNKGKMGWVYFPKNKSKRTFHFTRTANRKLQRIAIKNNFNAAKLAQIAKKVNLNEKLHRALLSASGIIVDKTTPYYQSSDNQKKSWNHLSKGNYAIDTALLKNLIDDKKLESNLIPVLIPNCTGAADAKSNKCRIWIKADINMLVDSISNVTQNASGTQSLFADCHQVKDMTKRFGPLTPEEKSLDQSLNPNANASANILKKKTGPDGINYIKNLEGYESIPYKDGVTLVNTGKKDQNGKIIKEPIQRWAIGFGHNISQRDKDALYRHPITEAKGNELLHQDLKRFENAVNKLVKVPISQKQFDALVLLTYNIGEGALGKSVLLKNINKKSSLFKIREQWKSWNKVTVILKNANKEKYEDKVVLKGLVNRRAKEWKIFYEGS